jgi:hypothetical protein
MATVALVLGILSLICCGGFTGVTAIITGVMARNEIARAPSLGGDNLAMTGIVLGSISVVATIALLALYVGRVATFMRAF